MRRSSDPRDEPRRRAGSRRTTRSQWQVLAAVCAAACAFPDYAFGPVGGSIAGSGAIAAGAGGIGMGSAAAPGTDASGFGGTGGGSDQGGSRNTSAGAGGLAGASSDGGAGGVSGSLRCADFAFLPENCSCHEYQAHAYFFCGAHRSFDTASTYCGLDGMKLARIDDTQESGWIASTASEQETPLEFYWIGASSQATPGTWSWTDGEDFWQGGEDGTLLGHAFVAWRMNAPTDPETTEPDELCAYVTVDGWEDTYCSDQRRYVCESY